ncbi:MAG: type II CAAX endopeptidase family protein [Chloroflexota bacterium]
MAQKTKRDFELLTSANPHIKAGRAEPLPKGVWRWYDATIMVVGTLIAIFASYFAVASFAGPDAPFTLVGVVSGFVQFAVMIMIVGVLALVSGVNLQDMGWRASHPMWIAIASAIVVPLLVVRLMALFVVAPFVVPFLPDVPADAPVVEEQTEEFFEPSAQPIVALGLVLLTAGVAPLVEETLFRGVLHHWLRNHMGLWAAAWISGLVFGAVHLNFPQFVTATLLGVVASWLYERSGSLVPAMVLHAINNFIAVGLEYVFIFIDLQLTV